MRTCNACGTGDDVERPFEGWKRRVLVLSVQLTRIRCSCGSRAHNSKMSDMNDPFHLQRFVDAQSGVIDRVYAELRAGKKHSHWMWFIFPQIRGLGSSRMAQEFAISSLAEANAYVAHPVLGLRLKTCTELAKAIEGRSIEEILGYPDHLKFHSSMTLFACAAPDELVFQAALHKFFGGNFD